MNPNDNKITAFATQGNGGLDELRLKILLEELEVRFLTIHKSNLIEKIKSAFIVLGACRKSQSTLIIMEGTGLLGGLPLILGRLLFGTQYVVSSGDAVGPFYGLRSPLARPFGAIYERLLCFFSRGFIGWTPYLTGRALTFGAPNAITAAGFQKFQKSDLERNESRDRIRKKLGIASDAIVVGIVGSLAWNPRAKYCYGYELVSSIKSIQRKNVVALIVGDGEGKKRLEELSGTSLNQNIFLTGRVNSEEVADYLAAMDIASLPQSVDPVGNFRYSTKMSEYLSAGLPMVVARNPFTYDLDRGSFWRLPGKTPWSETYIQAMQKMLETVTAEEISKKRSVGISEFDQKLQIKRVTNFIRDLLSP